MTSYAQQLKDRTFRFAEETVKLVRSLPPTLEAKKIGSQLFDAGTSVAANYRAACRARSRSEFIARIGIVVEEADEAAFWLDLLVSTSIVSVETVDRHRNEASQLVAIFTASHKTASERKRRA